MRVFEKWCDENSLEINLEMILLEQLDKVLERFYASACKQDETDFSRMILKVIKWFSREIRKQFHLLFIKFPIIFRAFRLKTRVKLFPDFTRHHLISHTNGYGLANQRNYEN